MNVIEGFILGLVQGLTEFLPVSSSGHLELMRRILGIQNDMITFDVAVHVATLVAVFAVFWKDILEILKKPFGKLPMLIVVGTIPTVIMGFAFKDKIESIFNSGSTLGLEFILTGLILVYAERVRNSNKQLKETTYTDAAIIGVAQGIAILPAISRSGLTIAGALFRGLNREFAAKISFLMSIPAIMGAAVLEGHDLFKSPGGIEASLDLFPLIVGVLAAGISGYFAIKFMIKILTKGSLKVFSYYVFALGIIIIIDQLFFGKLFDKLL